MNIINVRNIKIGEGIPKICVPIVAHTKGEILAEAARITEVPADVVEWRVDWYDEVEDITAVCKTAEALRSTLGDLPLLFTFRTAREGGEKEISATDYETLNLAAIRSGCIDLVDVEAFFEEDMAKRIIEAAHTAGVKVVASNHDFDKTPSKEELVKRLRYMQDINADIPKIAVMPQNKQDVLELLSATSEMKENYADRPIITMSMAKDGAISRLCGEVFGSALTFGTAGKASAPGQMEVEELSKVLHILHKLIG